MQYLLSNKESIIKSDLRFAAVKTLVIKVTHRCNLNCKYCYENITGGNDMSIEVAKKIIDLSMHNSTNKSLTFLLHGGEPTLMSFKWFDDFFEYAKILGEKCNKDIKFSIQTNLINVDSETLKLFKKHNVSVGVSLDNPYTSNFEMRKRSEIVLKNIKLLKLLGLSVGVLATINHSNFSDFGKIIEYLDTELHLKTFKANPVYSVGSGLNLPSLLPENYFKAYKDIIDYMIDTKGKQIIEKNLAIEIMRFFSTIDNSNSILRNTLCHEKKCGAGRNVLGITSEGYILPCGRFQWDDLAYYIGNINEADFDNSQYDASIENFHSLVPGNWYNCSDCSARKICSFGCQAFITRSLAKANIECLPTKMKYDYFVKRQDDLQEVYINLNRRFSKLIAEYDDEEEEVKIEGTDSRNDNFIIHSNLKNSYSDYSDDGGGGYLDR